MRRELLVSPKMRRSLPAVSDQLKTFSVGSVNDRSCCDLPFAFRKPVERERAHALIAVIQQNW